MSKQALYYYAENLPILQRAHFTDSTGKVRSIGENGRDLLVWLCDATNEKLGYTFHHSHRYMEENSGIHVSTVKRLLAGFEQLGWITRTGEEIRYQGRGAPTVEYVLTFYPKAWTEYEKWRTSSPTSSHRATDNVGKANTGKALPEKIDTETEPQPETKPQPGSLGNGEEGLSKEGRELLTHLLDTENYSGARNERAVRAAKKRDYLPIVKAWEKERPPGDPATWCRHNYLGTIPKTSPIQYLPPVPQGQENCPHSCSNGVHMIIDPDTQGWTSRWCVCAGGTYPTTQEPTTERVSADEATITYLHSPPAPADSGSDLIREMTKKLHRRF
jgi:hypothetical protein